MTSRPHIGTSGRAAKVALAVLAVALAAELAWFGSVVGGVEPAGATNKSVLESLGIEPATTASSPPISAFNEVTRRPLFETDRRQIVASVATGAGDATENKFAKDWRLTGVALGESRSVAILENTRSGEVISLVTGESTDGWSIEQIDSNKVVIRSGANRREFVLNSDDNRAKSIAERNGVLVRSD